MFSIVRVRCALERSSTRHIALGEPGGIDHPMGGGCWASQLGIEVAGIIGGWRASPDQKLEVAGFAQRFRAG